ncbi:acylneuraminate cytidylyltransferase family protein [Chlorobium sp. BLA1]|uniref:acylneuraminate cytidylyltransferase family protein n=1 Tax=Candidatus Chlorobium masyuteum TaxID=2716876 RepID=UPI00141EBA44|nr:acylneuraminate cytidylyltransferase family protein [Candidatus Chlorobium masyuteum]NHQ60468.1 acylneuraminate cytidylyltransferase family protein [Candidatus Chlorobium masyuteum]
MHTVAIIPARGGSKGLKNKNIYPVAGKPLLAWTILQALSSKRIDRVFVSTDNPEIAAVARAYGAEVIERPQELSGDKASSESAVLHAVGVIEADYGLSINTIVFLQATSPLRNSGDIDRAVELYERDGADSLISVTRADDLTIWESREGKWSSLNFDHRNRGMRQDRPAQFIENGSIYIFTPETLKTFNNRIGARLSAYEMEFWQTWEIDTVEEIDLIEFYLYKKNLAGQVAALNNP